MRQPQHQAEKHGHGSGASDDPVITFPALIEAHAVIEQIHCPNQSE